MPTYRIEVVFDAIMKVDIEADTIPEAIAAALNYDYSDYEIDPEGKTLRFHKIDELEV